MKTPRPARTADIVTTLVVGAGTAFVASRIRTLSTATAGVIGLAAMAGWYFYTTREPTVDEALSTHAENGWYHRGRAATSFSGGITE